MVACWMWDCQVSFFFNWKQGFKHSRKKGKNLFNESLSENSCKYYLQAMGCAVCSHLLDLLVVKVSRTGPGAMELSSCPQSLHGGYHRVTGLHYTSSFSDAEDCCDDTSSGDGEDWGPTPSQRKRRVQNCYLSVHTHSSQQCKAWFHCKMLHLFIFHLKIVADF